MYVPTLARFTARDPVAANAPMVLYSQSPYVYAMNQPLRFVDPSGLQEEDEFGPLDPPPPPLPEDATPVHPVYPVDPLPAGHETWECKPPRGRGGRGGYPLYRERTYTVMIDTCCQANVEVDVLGRRCFRPGFVETDDDKEAGANFYTEVVIRTRVEPVFGACPDAYWTAAIVCRIFPGRFISRLQNHIPPITVWPPDDVTEHDDLNLEGIAEAACEAVRNTEPNRS